MSDDAPPAGWLVAAGLAVIMALILALLLIVGAEINADTECRQMCRRGYVYAHGVCVCIEVAPPGETR